MSTIYSGSVIFCGALSGMLQDTNNYLFVVAAAGGLSLALRGVAALTASLVSTTRQP